MREQKPWKWNWFPDKLLQRKGTDYRLYLKLSIKSQLILKNINVPPKILWNNLCISLRILLCDMWEQCALFTVCYILTSMNFLSDTSSNTCWSSGFEPKTSHLSGRHEDTHELRIINFDTTWILASLMKVSFYFNENTVQLTMIAGRRLRVYLLIFVIMKIHCKRWFAISQGSKFYCLVFLNLKSEEENSKRHVACNVKVMKSCNIHHVQCKSFMLRCI